MGLSFVHVRLVLMFVRGLAVACIDKCILVFKSGMVFSPGHASANKMTGPQKWSLNGCFRIPHVL